jgi:hypothetical protein
VRPDRSRAAFTVGLCVLLVGSTVAPVAAQAGSTGTVIGTPELDLLATSQEFEPGTQAQLRLALSNRGRIDRGGPAQYETRVTTARGVVVEARPGSAPIEVNSGSVGVGNVPTGTTQVPPIEITVSEDVAPGTYRVPVEVSYAYTRSVEYGPYSPEYNDFEDEETIYVTIRVRDQARFAVVDSETGAQVGDRGRLAVTVENVGTRTARDASVTARSRSDELTFGTGSAQSTANAGTWAPGERQTLEYTVSTAADATVRDYTVDLTVDYLDTDGIDRASRTLNVGLRPEPEQSFALRNVSTSLRVGEEGRVTGTVVNEGPGTARNPVVLFSLSNPNVVVDSGEYAVDDLAPGERARFAYTVTVSSAASASVQQLEFTTRYRNARNDLRESDGLETKTRIEPRRDRFVVETATDGIGAGSDEAVTVRITNNGDEPLRNVEAKAFVESPLSSDNDEAIVTTLAPGETANATIALSAAGDALPKTYPVSFDLQYETPDGDTEVSRTYTTAVRVTEGEDDGFPVSLAVGALVVVGLLGAVGWRRRSG